jgi:sporulation protein YlmC with PRC-barrel domain
MENVMTKSFVAAVALMACGLPAMAQTTTTPPPASPPAATTSPAPWYSHKADEMRASKLIGTKVVNTANETIGDINEVVLGKDGKVAAVVIGVGGFLGMGEREVAVNFSSLRHTRDGNNNLIVTADATKDSLKAAPEWRWDTSKK